MKNEVFLTVNELANMGAELVEITQEIDLNIITINSLEVTRNQDPETFTLLISQYLETIYRINENLSSKLDNMACLLLNADNEKELEGFRNAK